MNKDVFPYPDSGKKVHVLHSQDNDQVMLTHFPVTCISKET